MFHKSTNRPRTASPPKFNQLQPVRHHNASNRTFQEHFSPTTNAFRLLPPAPPGNIRAMLSVIIPTLNAEAELPATFAAIMPAVIDGMIREVIIVDGGSSDATAGIADAAGAKLLTTPEPGRGQQLALGANTARSDWLLFLHADTELEENWHQEARAFITGELKGLDGKETSACFTFALNDKGIGPAFLTRLVALRCRLFALPYGDQALLISKENYQKAGGYAPLPIMEDVDLIRRLKPRPHILRARAFTSARRYRRDGYIHRSLRNLYCLAAYYRGVQPEKIKTIYQGNP